MPDSSCDRLPDARDERAGVCSKAPPKRHTAQIPVMMLTARGFDVDDQQNISLKIAQCLSKPFSPREVLQSIEDVLTRTAVITLNT